MSYFKELNNNIMTIIMKLTDSQDLCKLLNYSSSSPLNEPDIADTSQLIFTKIFPLPKLPDAKDENQDSFLTVMFDDVSLAQRNIGYKNSIICFNLFCHIKLWETKDGLRPYSIASEIDKLFNDQRIVGIGKTIFNRMRLFSVNEFYYGFKLEYSITDFNN